MTWQRAEASRFFHQAMLSVSGWLLLHSGCAGKAPVVKPTPGEQAQVAPLKPAAASDRADCAFREEAQSEKARALIAEGVSLHDRGDYEGAVRRYQEVLAADPADLIALHEISTTEMTWGHYKEAIEHARAGLRCPSPYRMTFYITLGSALDEMKQPGEAIAAFKDGLKEAAAIERAGQPDPRHWKAKELLLYNLALNLLREGQPDESRGYAEQAALLIPSHPSPYLVLGMAHEELGNRIPAVLSLLRFVAVEATSNRAKQAAQHVLELLDAGVDRSKRVIKVSLPSGNNSEGDFQGADMILSLVSAAAAGQTSELRQKQLEALAAFLSEKPAGAKSFTVLHNVRFLHEVEKQKLLEPLTQLLMALSDHDAAIAWVRANSRRVAELVNFARSFKN